MNRHVSEKIEALCELGSVLRDYLQQGRSRDQLMDGNLDLMLKEAADQNPWFTREMILLSLSAISAWLTAEKLVSWITCYPDLDKTYENPRKIGVVSAGNIPLVGFHDYLCVFLSGHEYVGKLSSQDKVLLPLIHSWLQEKITLKSRDIHFTEGFMKGTDAVIATGSNNTYRYFEYYFRDQPRLIRKNRNGIAVLNGKETEEELIRLGTDVFSYFGMGCRSVSKLYVPESYDVTQLFPYWQQYEQTGFHHKYRNNYDYYKSVFLINRDNHADNGFLLLKREPHLISSPVSVVYYEEYRNIQELVSKLSQIKEQIQCLVSHVDSLPAAIPFGSAQSPGLSDYADGIDTMKFLLSV